MHPDYTSGLNNVRKVFVILSMTHKWTCTFKVIQMKDMSLEFKLCKIACFRCSLVWCNVAS